MGKRIITFTDAPKAYDGFGTKTLRVLGKRRGKEVRIVETPEEHAQWQRDRYASGLYFAFDRRMWDEYKFAGELEGLGKLGRDTEEFLLNTAERFRQLARTETIMETPRVERWGDRYHLQLRLKPYNRLGVNSVNVWVDGDDARAQVVGHVPGEGRGAGFEQRYAEKEFSVVNLKTPRQLTDILYGMSKEME
jgi:hypothetical protein